MLYSTSPKYITLLELESESSDSSGPPFTSLGRLFWDELLADLSDSSTDSEPEQTDLLKLKQDTHWRSRGFEPDQHWSERNPGWNDHWTEEQNKGWNLRYSEEEWKEWRKKRTSNRIKQGEQYIKAIIYIQTFFRNYKVKTSRKHL